MDLSQLKSLGEVAGIGGISLGVVVLLVRPLIATVAGLPQDARAGTVKWIATGCFAIGALGIVAWTVGNRSSVATAGSQSPAVISNGSASISYGAPSAEQPSSPPKPSSSTAATSGIVNTKGSQSPAVVSGGNVRIQYSTNPSTTPSPPK